MTAESKDTVLKQWILEATQGVCTQDDLLRALDKRGTHIRRSDLVRVLAEAPTDELCKQANAIVLEALDPFRA